MRNKLEKFLRTFKQRQWPRLQKDGMFYSAVLHMVLLLFVTFGLPRVIQKPVNDQIILVEYAPIGALTQSPQQEKKAPSQKKATKQKDAKPPEPVPPSPPKPAESKPAPTQVTTPVKADKPEPKPEEKPKPEQDVVLRKDNQDQKNDGKDNQPQRLDNKKEKNTSKEETAVVDRSKRKATKTKETKPQKRKKDDFASMLDALEKLEGSDDAIEENEEVNGEKSAVVQTLGEKLSVSEEDAVRRQLEKCWSIIPGGKGAEDITVTLSLWVDSDGTVRKAENMDPNRYHRDPVFRSATDAAMRAVRNALCSPLNLPKNKYDQWKQFTISFNPSQMYN